MSIIERKHVGGTGYRPDIDGLRAISVILVVLFHYGLGFPGGFVGVDVFFVISGYLITGVIANGVAGGSFSMTEFWVRRICRILPAALVTTLLTLVVGYFLLLPGAYSRAAQVAFFGQVMAANLRLWSLPGGYFGASPDLEPFLHYWSLAVEEQYYLVYPLLLATGLRSRRTLLPMMLLVTVVSLLLSEYLVFSFPTFGYFMLPSRAWEMLLGSLICFVPPPRLRSFALLSVLELLALAAIVASGCSFDAGTRFPGFFALLPVGGATLLIWAGRGGGGLVKLTLSAKPLVLVGLVSYSLYLVHWPVLVFLRHASAAEPSLPQRVSLLPISLALAWVSWRFVEQPLRRVPGRYSSTRVFAVAGAVSVSIMGYSLFVYLMSGLPARLPQQVRDYAAESSSMGSPIQLSVQDALGGRIPCTVDIESSESCLIWGDSHAMALAPGLESACRSENIQLYQATYSSTPPLLGLGYDRPPYGLGVEAPQWNRAVLKFVGDHKVGLVVMAGIWSTYLDECGLELFENSLRNTLDSLTSRGARVAMVLRCPVHEVDVPRYYAQRTLMGQGIDYCGLSSVKYESEYGRSNETIRRICAEFPAAVVLDPGEILRDPHGVWVVAVDGELLYRDDNHLNVRGGLRMAALFEEVLGRLSFEAKK